MTTHPFTARLLALAVVPVVALSACATTTSTTRTFGSPAPAWVRYGRVEQVTETLTRHEGNPVGGAAVGAIIGGLLGSAIGGHGHYDRWGYYHQHASGTGALVGAVGGAAVGAAASQGSGEERTYAVTVRFDDGAAQTYGYRNASPFQVGERVALSPRGIQRVRAAGPAPAPPTPAPSVTPPPPPSTLPAPPASSAPAAPQQPAPGVSAQPPAPGSSAQPSYPSPSEGPTLPPPADPYGAYGPPSAPFDDTPQTPAR